jgi:hypothetical protein
MEAEAAHNKGRVMEAILQRYSQRQLDDGSAAAAVTTVGKHDGNKSGCPFASSSSRADDKQGMASSVSTEGQPGGITAGSQAQTLTAISLETEFEVARQQLYSWVCVPPAFRQEVTAELARQVDQLGLAPQHQHEGYGAHDADSPAAVRPLAFLDHAWGQIAPLAQVRCSALRW